MPQILDLELDTYQRHRNELLGKAEGKFVLIHGDRILGIFDSRNDAIRQGYQSVGNVPFLVKQIVKVEIPQTLVSNHLGL